MPAWPELEREDEMWGKATTGKAGAQEPAAALPSRRPEAGAGPPPDRELGRQIALRGIPERKVPSCVDCHGPGEHPRNPAYPLLAGQYPAYLELQLGLFKKCIRGGSDYRRLMDEVVHGLSEDKIPAVARWYGDG